jgi:hypothetical protein
VPPTMYRQRRAARAFNYQRHCGSTALVSGTTARDFGRGQWHGAPAYEALSNFTGIGVKHAGVKRARSDIDRSRPVS